MRKTVRSLLTIMSMVILLVCAFTCNTVFASASTTDNEPYFSFDSSSVKWNEGAEQFEVSFGGDNPTVGQQFTPVLNNYTGNYVLVVDRNGDGVYDSDNETAGGRDFYNAGTYKFAAVDNKGDVIAKSVLVINKLAYPGTRPVKSDLYRSEYTSYYDGDEVTPEEIVGLFEEYFVYSKDNGVRIVFSCNQTIKYADTYKINVSFEHDNYTLSERFEITYTVKKHKVEAPVFTDIQLVKVYNGTTQTLINTEGKAYTSNGTNTAKNAGYHTVTLTLIDKEMYEWADGTTADKRYTFLVDRAPINKPGFDETNFAYNGAEQEYRIAPNSLYTVSGNKHTDSGTYTVEIALTDPNYMWNDGSIEPLHYEFVINPYEVARPTYVRNNFVYSGAEHKLVLIHNQLNYEQYYTFEGELTATNVKDSHKIVFTLKNGDVINYVWKNGDESPLEIEFNVTPKPVRINVSNLFGLSSAIDEEGNTYYKQSFLYDGKSHTASLLDGKTLPEGVTEWFIVDERTAYVKEYTETAKVIYIGFKTGDNYADVENVKVELTVNKRVVSVPTESDENVFVYDGKVKEYAIPASDFYTVTGNKVTDAGAYTVTVSLVSDSCVWADGTTDDKEFTFEILKGRYDFTPSFDKVSLKYNNLHQNPTIKNLPNGLEVEYTYERFVIDSFIYTTDSIAPGKYRVTAHFIVDENNYEPFDSVSVEYEIYLDYARGSSTCTDSSDNKIVTVECSKPIPDYLTLNVSDVTGAYKRVKLPDGATAKVLLAYDIEYIGYGVEETPEGTFVITLYLPNDVLDNKNIVVAYVNDEGEAVVHEHTVIDGAVVIETDHFSVYAVLDPTDVYVAPKDNNNWIYIVIAVAVVVIIIIALLIFFLRKRALRNRAALPVDEVAEEAPTEPVAVEEVLTVEEPVVEEPVVEEAAVEEPAPVVAEEPAPVVAEEPVVEEASPVVEEPVVEEPAPVVAEEPAVEEPAPTVEEPQKAENVASESANQTVINGDVVEVHYRSSFQSRLIQADKDVQDYYTVIKNTLLSYKGIKARTSWNFETFGKGRIKCAKVNVKGKTLVVNLNLNPVDFNINKYHFNDMSGKPKFEDAPLMMKIKSERALKYTIELIDEMMKLFEIEQGEIPNVDYHMPYEDTETLAQRGLVKVTLPAGVKLEGNAATTSIDVDEVINKSKEQAPVAEEPVVEEAAPVVAEESVVEEVAPVAEEPAVEEVAPVAEEPAVEEATPVVAEEPVVEEAAPVVAEEPVVEEAAPVVAEEPVVEEAAPVVVEEPAPVVAEEPVVEEVTPVVEAPIVNEEHIVEEPVFVDAIHADELISDTEAEECVTVIESNNKPQGKMVTVNLDVICENFENGDEVNIATLKAKKLISASAGRVKILARGVMTKQLTVTADKYSIQAVKMIILAGGKANMLE